MTNKILHLIARAQLNDKEALNDLGSLYFTGNGIKKNDKKALEYYERAAKQCYPNAQFNLGVMYEQGFGVEKNIMQAIDYYELAAKQNYLPAQFNLAYLYEKNQQTLSLAFFWYRRAAENHFAQAQNNLGWMYFKGLSVPQNAEQAVYWFNQAAAQNVP